MKKISIVIVLTIFITSIFIVIKDQFESQLLKNANYGIPQLIKKKKIDNLYIGSSMFRQGLDTKVLENGFDDYIISYNGNNPILELWIIQYLLKNNVEIRNLYIDMYAYALTSPPSISDSKILMEVGLNEKYELYKLISEKSDISKFYSIFVNENIELLFTWPIYYNLVNSTYYKGGIIRGQDGIDSLTLDNLKMIKQSEIDNRNIVSINKIIQICNEKNINLYFLETPKSSRVMKDENYQNLMSEYKKILNDNKIKYYLAENVNNNISEDSYNFFDLIHLSNKGRKLYSLSLKELLKNEKYN